MSLARVFSRAGVGVTAPLVKVEVHLGGGLPRMSMVGLPETAVREAKDRVKAALLNARFDFPQRHITISLAPADLPPVAPSDELTGTAVAAATMPRPTPEAMFAIVSKNPTVYPPRSRRRASATSSALEIPAGCG